VTITPRTPEIGFGQQPAAFSHDSTPEMTQAGLQGPAFPALRFRPSLALTTCPPPKPVGIALAPCGELQPDKGLRALLWRAYFIVIVGHFRERQRGPGGKRLAARVWVWPRVVEDRGVLVPERSLPPHSSRGSPHRPLAHSSHLSRRPIRFSIVTRIPCPNGWVWTRGQEELTWIVAGEDRVEVQLPGSR
jgi:hypothetical protein